MTATYDGPPTWELQPGSDTPGDRVSPWQYIGTNGTWDLYACLISTSMPLGTVSGIYDLYDAETPWTTTAIFAPATSVATPGLPAGTYLACAFPSPGGSPGGLPEDWTPVEGPKFVGTWSLDDGGNGYTYWAGKVRVTDQALIDAMSADPGNRWLLAPLDTPMTPAGIDGATTLTEPGDYLGWYGDNATNDYGPPQGWPEGWTPLTSVTGPIAITDENAGGVIGDIAYVVSGYVYNSVQLFMDALPADAVVHRWSDIGDGVEFTVAVGDYILSGSQSLEHVTSGGTWIFSNSGASGGGSATSDTVSGERYWPYLERYDLKNKAWLPRVPLPFLSGTSGPRYASEGGFAGVIDGKLYFGGGDGDDITGTEFFCYDPATQTFERLADFPSAEPGGFMADYAPYGVVSGKLWALMPGNVAHAASYDVVTGAWNLQVVDAPGNWSDQIQGVEIDGKLYFVYDKAYVFDPVALAVEEKAATPTLLSRPAASWRGSDGVHVMASEAGVNTNHEYVHDITLDTWSEADHVGVLHTGYAVAVVYNSVPYILSGLYGPVRFGAYGLTGNLVETVVDNHDPHQIGDTSGADGGWGTFRVGDPDDHSRDPKPFEDTTVLGGGPGLPGQPYRAPVEQPAVTIRDTSGRGGAMPVHPTSPNKAVVGDDSGVNPNAVEP